MTVRDPNPCARTRGPTAGPGSSPRPAGRKPPARTKPRALSRAHAASVGRYLTDLSAEQLADVEAEAGALLRELGYVSSASA